MKKYVFMSCIVLLILVLPAAAPVAAAALSSAVTCPSSCACLLPAEAAKINTPGLCGGKQMVCGGDVKNQKYCYERPVTTTTVPQLPITAKPYVTLIKPTVTTAITGTIRSSSPCPSGCTCLKSGDGEAKGLAYCGGKQVTCGDETGTTPLFCFSQKIPATGTVAAGVPAGTPLTRSVPAGSLSPVAAVTARGTVAITGTTGTPLSGPVAHQVMPAPAMPQATTAPPAPAGSEPAGGGIVSAIMNFFGSLFGDPQGSPQSQQVSCGGVRTTLMNDPQNCGACGTVCPSGACVAGVCREEGPEMAARPCGPYQAPCNGVCTSILSDDDNCGGCGNRCPVLQDCCAGHCTDRYADASNCGACGVACSPGHACCNGRCTDLATDWFNCGSCGRSCDHPHGCCNGTCRDLYYDDSNCGACGNTCGAGQTCCWPGRCQDSCGYHSSGSGSKGAGSDTGIPDVVPAGVLGSVVIIGAASGSDDAAGGTEVCLTSETCHRFMTCCSDYCWNLNISSFHCGACGNVCPPDRPVCNHGTCDTGRPPVQP